MLDNRLAQLETDIAANGRQLASAPGNLLANASTGQSSNFGVGPIGPGQITAISIVFLLFVMAPVAMAMARSIFRRSSQPTASPLVLQSAERLERMEQSVDAIAVEVERISEGQRFVTGLLAKRGESAALPSQPGGELLRAAQPLTASARDSR